VVLLLRPPQGLFWNFYNVYFRKVLSNLSKEISWQIFESKLFLKRNRAKSLFNTVLTNKFHRITNLIALLWFKKIWCASWARVNLPHISNKKYIKIILQRNLPKNTQGLSFFSRNLYRKYRWDIKYQNSEYFFWFLDLNIVTKSTIRFVLRWYFLNKTQGLTLLSRNLYGRYP
jgi:hypothetical protein